jgi:hypothetical protein
MRGNAENHLDDDVADVQDRPERECAPKISWRMRVSQSAVIMVVPLPMPLVIVVAHPAILLRFL